MLFPLFLYFHTHSISRLGKTFTILSSSLIKYLENYKLFSYSFKRQCLNFKKNTPARENNFLLQDCLRLASKICIYLKFKFKK